MKDFFNIKTYYDTVNTQINKKFFADFMPINEYPGFIKEKSLALIKDKFTCNIIDINEFINSMYMMRDFGCFDAINIGNAF